MSMPKECKDGDCEWEPTWEDHILMGPIYYGQQCKKCRKEKYKEPGPLELGTYR